MNDVDRAVFDLVRVPLWEVQLPAAIVIQQNAPASELFDAQVIENARALFESLSTDSQRSESHISAIGRDGLLKTGRVSATRLPGDRALVTFAEDTLPALEETERRFRSMADAAPVLLWMSGRDGECNFFNKTWLEFSGRTMENEIGVGWAEGVHFEDFQRCMHIYLDSFVARRPFRMEYRLQRGDGQFRWILDTGVPRFESDGSFAGFIGSCIDVTELKEVHIELDAHVREREALIKEVHHRVKNNLQVISSLINLQARRLDGRDPQLVLEESQGRIFSIALIHERLYRSKDLEHIGFADYLKSLIESISNTFGHDSARVSISTDVDDIELTVERAIPCGLIIHELTTNALKYAFPSDRKGNVRISLKREPFDLSLAVLEVCDDGVGLPEEIVLEHAASLGLFLVGTLAEQLGARLAVKRGKGTSFRIAFRL